MTSGTKIQSSTGRKFLLGGLRIIGGCLATPNPLPCSWAHSRFFQLTPLATARRFWQEEAEGVELLEQATVIAEGGVLMQTSPITPTPFLRRTLRFPPSMETVLTEHMTPKIQNLTSQTNTAPKGMKTSMHMNDMALYRRHPSCQNAIDR